MGGLIIVDPATPLRDWMRTALDQPNVWLLGWPSGNHDDIGIVMHQITSTLNGPVTTWSWQIDHYAATAPVASAMATRTLTLLAETAPRTLIGSTDDGQVLYGGLIESTASLSPIPVDPANPDLYGHRLDAAIATTTIPNPTP